MAGTFNNEDVWTGYKYQEDTTWWFRAIDKNGNEYDTQEIPNTKPILTITQYMGDWTGEEIKNEDRKRKTRFSPINNYQVIQKE